MPCAIIFRLGGGTPGESPVPSPHRGCCPLAVLWSFSPPRVSAVAAPLPSCLNQRLRPTGKGGRKGERQGRRAKVAPLRFAPLAPALTLALGETKGATRHALSWEDLRRQEGKARQGCREKAPGPHPAENQGLAEAAQRSFSLLINSQDLSMA